MGGKTSTSTSTVQVPQDVLARYNSVNDTAQAAASTPFQAYSSDPNAFVAPLSATQQAGIQNTNTAAGQAQPYYQNATGNLLAAQNDGSSQQWAAKQGVQVAQNAATPLYNQAQGQISTGLNDAAGYIGQSNNYNMQGLGAGTGYLNSATNALGQAQGAASPYYANATDSLNQGASLGLGGLHNSNLQTGYGLQASSAYGNAATDYAGQGAQAVNAQQIGADQINQFMNPYLSSVLGSTASLLNQNNQQAMAGQLGNAINSGAFGGDRAGIAAANLSQQQNLANANIYSGIASNAYNSALGAAQQQQGVNLGAAQANREALQNASTQYANIGAQEAAQNFAGAQQLASNANSAFGIGAGQSSGLAGLGAGVYGMGANTANSLANYGQNAYNMNTGVANANLNTAQNVYNFNSGAATSLQNLGQTAYNTGANTANSIANYGNNLYNIEGNTANSLAGLGAGAQSAALQGATAQLSAGQQEQATQQAGLTSLYNQFLQQQAYPFQTAQFLANVAEGTGSLSGSTTTSTQPTGLFGNLLSDRRAKEDIKEVGRAKNGLKIYTFRYKGDPEKVTHLGFMADEVEKKHPEAVGLAGGLKTVDYERAARADGGGLVFDPNAGEYGLGAAGMPGRGTYVPAPIQSAARHIMFQANPPAMKTNSGGLGAVADDYKQIKSLYNDGSQIWNDGKKFVSGLSDGTYSHGGLALKRDYGGPIDDPFQSDADLMRRQKGLAAGEHLIENAPNNAANGPVSGALSAQDNSPRYQLNAAPQAKSGGNSNGLGQLAGLASLASNVSPYILGMFGLKDGGLVPREHHADGDIVGDDNINPHGDAPVDTPASPAQMYDRERASGLAGMMGRGLPSNYHPSGTDVPTPPRRPEGLGITPDDVRALPDFKMPDELKPWHGSNYGDDQGLNEAPASRQATGLAASPWRAPAYTGPRPSEAPNPANYGTDQAGQTAFIRDYATYKGIDPRFALGVANAEGLRAIGPNNPNGASTVDIDPNTGKPFSFGAFQLNVRNGLGNVAMAKGIDPTNPAHANIANQFALDQMAEGGLKPWRGDAAVKAYQGGQGMSAGLGAAAPQAAQAAQQPGGLMGSLTSFFHGNPDGQTSPNGGMGERALMAVLSGLGAVGSYKGQSPLGAILQGLGAGAHGWMESGKQQADIANEQAGTNYTNVGAARNSVLPEFGYILGPDGKLHVVDKSIGTTGVPLMGGVPSAATKTVSPTTGSGPAVSSTPAAPSAPTAPSAPKGPDLTGVGYDKDSANRAANEVLAGPQGKEDLKQSADYQNATRQGSLKAQETAPYTRTLATVIANNAAKAGPAASGAGFTDRASMVNALNTLDRMFGGDGTRFGDADVGSTLANKVNTLQGVMRAQGADERSLGALEMLKGANATLDQPPAASAEIASRLMTDQMRAQDRQTHMEHWKADSPLGSVLGAQSDFTSKNGPQKYDRETEELKDLMLKSPKAFALMNSGKLTAQQIAEALKAYHQDPNLVRYFARGQSNG